MSVTIPRAAWLTRPAAQGSGLRAATGRDLLVLGLIVLVACIPRFSYPEVIDWSKDHSDMAMVAQDIVAGKGIPLIGQPSSAGLPHSPFYIYILAIPYAITSDPVLVTLFIAAFSLLGVGLVWLIVFRYIDRTAALVAGLAYAVNPWEASFSRTIWSGDHRAPLLLLGILLGLRGFVEGRRLAQILCLPVMLIALQIHYAAWAVLPVYVYLVWSGRARTTWPRLALSAALGALAVLPFAIGLAQLLGAPRSDAALHALTREIALRDVAKPYVYMAWLTTGLGTEQYLARQNAAALIAESRVPVWLWLAQGGAALLGAAHLLRQYRRDIAAIVLIWVVAPLLAFTLPIVGVFPHYFIPVLPALCMLVGVGFKRILDLLGGRARAAALAWLICAATLASQAAFVLATLRYVDATFTPSQFGFGTPVHYMRPIQRELARYSDVVFIASDDWLDFSRASSWVWAPFLRGSAACLRDVQVGGHLAVYPAQPFAAVFAPRVPADAMLTQLYGTPDPAVFALRQGEGAYRVGAMERTADWPGAPFTAIAPVAFANGVQLTGYQRAPERLALEWRLPAATATDYHYAIDVLGDGGVLLSAPADFWPGKNWCQGDRLVTWHDIALPSGATAVRVRMLAPGGSAVPVRDRAGHLSDTQAVIALVR